jgi:hypothetical protein
MGHVKEEARAFREGYMFQPAGPFGVADTRLNRGICDFVTIAVTYCFNLAPFVSVTVT